MGKHLEQVKTVEVKKPRCFGEAFLLTKALVKPTPYSINDRAAEKVQSQVEADAPVAVSSETIRPAAV